VTDTRISVMDALAQMLGLTDAQVDELFIAADQVSA
jgi:hypothetical protein